MCPFTESLKDWHVVKSSYKASVHWCWPSLVSWIRGSFWGPKKKTGSRSAPFLGGESSLSWWREWYWWKNHFARFGADVYSLWHFNLGVIDSIAFRARPFPFIDFSPSLSDLKSTSCWLHSPSSHQELCLDNAHHHANKVLHKQGGLKAQEGTWHSFKGERTLNPPLTFHFLPAICPKWYAGYKVKMDVLAANTL